MPRSTNLMADGPDEVSRDLALVQQGTASFEVRAALETHLLNVLRHGGTEVLSALLGSIEPECERADQGPSGSWTKNSTSRCGGDPVT